MGAWRAGKCDVKGVLAVAGIGVARLISVTGFGLVGLALGHIALNSPTLHALLR